MAMRRAPSPHVGTPAAINPCHRLPSLDGDPALRMVAGSPKVSRNSAGMMARALACRRCRRYG